jgi:hypothetical protein
MDELVSKGCPHSREATPGEGEGALGGLFSFLESGEGRGTYLLLCRLQNLWWVL